MSQNEQVPQTPAPAENTVPLAPFPPPLKTFFVTGLNHFWVLSCFALLIAVLTYIGTFGLVSPYFIILLFIPSESDLFLFGAPAALIPIAIVVILFTLGSWYWGRRIYRRENRSYQAFFFSTALYVVLTTGMLVAIPLLLAVGSAVSPDADPLLSISLGYLLVFMIGLGQYISYFGLVLLLVLIVFSLRKEIVPTRATSLASNIFRYVIIGLAILISLYTSGIFSYAGQVTGLNSFCDETVKDADGTHCYINTTKGKFEAVKLPSTPVTGLADVGGKLAYVTSEESADMDLYIGDLKSYIVWDGKEYGKEYAGVSNPTDVGGKLAYIATKDADDISAKTFIVWDGKEYGTEFVGVDDLTNFDGQLAYIGSKDPESFQDEQSYIVIGDKKYGPHQLAGRLRIENGHVIAVVNDDQGWKFFADSKEYGESIDINSDRGIFINDKFVYSQNGAIFIEDTKVDVEVAAEGPFAVDEKLVFLEQLESTSEDKNWRLMIDGKQVGEVIVGDLLKFDVSKNGRVGVKVYTKDELGEIQGHFYLDGEQVHTENKLYAHTFFKFFGDKLLFEFYENSTPFLWYGGDKIGNGFEMFDEENIVLVNDKLVIPAMRDSYDGEDVESYLLIEQ